MVNILKVSRYWTLTFIHVFSAFKFYLSINFHNSLVWWNDYLTSVLYYKDGSELCTEAISFPSLFVGIPFFLSYNVHFYECVVCKEWGSALTTIFMLLFLNSFDASFKLTHWQTPSLCHHSNRWDIHGIGKMLPGCSSVGDWRKVGDLYV